MIEWSYYCPELVSKLENNNFLIKDGLTQDSQEQQTILSKNFNDRKMFI